MLFRSGVLVLSRFAGAAAELDGALIVNPHEVEAVAEAIGIALDMPLEERQERHARMFAHLLTNDVDQWAELFLTTLAESRQRPRSLENRQEPLASPIGRTG